MEFDFDSNKDRLNRQDHGLPLAFGIRIFEDDHHIVVASIRPIDREDRYKVIGLVDGKLHTGVHVWRGEVVRFISVRRSNANEQRNYDRHSRRSG